MTKTEKEYLAGFIISGVICIIGWFIAAAFGCGGKAFLILLLGIALIVIPIIYISNQDIKKTTPLTGNAGNYYNAYRLASDMVFATCYNKQATRSLTATSGSADLNAHTSAVVRIKKERAENHSEASDFSSHPKLSTDKLTETELINWLNQNREQDIRAFTRAISKKVQPEKIRNDLSDVLKQDIDFIKSTNLYKSGLPSVDDINKALSKPLSDFDRRFGIVFDCNIGSAKRAESMATDAALTADTRGMGFGIITSSATEAALFSAMDKHAHSKQRENAYYHTRTLMEGGNDKAFYSGVMQAYRTFEKDMQTAINNVYAKITPFTHSKGNINPYTKNDIKTTPKKSQNAKLDTATMWKCPKCNNFNFANSNECMNCHTKVQFK